MIQQNVYSIGHGTKSISDFISELKSFDIQYLIDIRSKPYSKYNPQFNQNQLKHSIEAEQIRYVYMGEELGGLPIFDPTCFFPDGRVDYDKLKTKEFFRNGLSRLENSNNQGLRVCIMCSESNPKDCHRSKLVGVELQKMDIDLRHIIGLAKEKSQNAVILEATNGNGLLNLFGEEEPFHSKKSYI